MKTWAKLTLVTATVGGGFAGIVVTIQSAMQAVGQTSTYWILMALLIGLYSYVTVAGLIFVQNPLRTGPLVVALTLQVPWVSSPLLVYQFAAGFKAVLEIGRVASNGEMGLKFDSFFGSTGSLAVLQDQPFKVGVNLWAIAMLVLVTSSAPAFPQAQSPLTRSMAHTPQ